MSEPVEPERDLEQRVAHLEEEVSHLRGEVARSASDAAAARVLAGGADRDVSDMHAELRAHTRALNALCATQVELSESQRDLSAWARAFEGSVNVRFEGVDEGLQQIAGMLRTLIDREGPSVDPPNGGPRQR